MSAVDAEEKKPRQRRVKRRRQQHLAADDDLTSPTSTSTVPATTNVATITTVAGAPDTPSEAFVEADPANCHMSLLGLFGLFFSFGWRAWGGPLVQIDMLRSHFVDDKKWISKQRFNRVLAVYQALPGPEATELACYFGMLSRGRVGSVLAGLGFILPGFLLMLLLAWLYDSFYRYAMDTPARRYILASFTAVQSCVSAMVVRAVHRLGMNALQHSDTKQISMFLVLLAFLAGLQNVLGINFFITLGVGGVLNVLYERGRVIAAEGNEQHTRRHWLWYGAAIGFFVLCIVAYVLYRVYGTGASGLNEFSGTGIVNTSSPSLGVLFVVGLLAGLVTFGGAYTTIPFVRVESLLWITPGVFLDSIALAQIIPTPLVMFISFLGYIGGGVGGALVMTLGVFLPAFSFTLIGHNLFERIVDMFAVRAVLDGITASVIGQVAITAFELIRDTAAQSTGLVIVFVLSLAALYQIASPWTPPGVILSAALVGQVLFPVNKMIAVTMTAAAATTNTMIATNVTAATTSAVPSNTTTM